MRTCQHDYKRSNHDQREPCSHPCWGDSDFCLFHHSNVEAKQEEFSPAFEAFLVSAETDEKIDFIDCEGFIFPAIDFQSRPFTKAITFRSSRFTSHAEFSECEFNLDSTFANSSFTSDAVFNESNFKGRVSFERARFGGTSEFIGVTFYSHSTFSKAKFKLQIDFGSSIFHSAHFDETIFMDDTSFLSASFQREAIFTRASFYARADFDDTNFEDLVTFSRCKFSGYASFNEAYFFEYTVFRYCTFLGLLEFTESCFSERVDFAQCIIRNEIYFDRSEFAFLKNPPGVEVSLRYAVLEAAHLWGLDTLTRYDLRDAFVLGVTLAGKALVDCDFTGAVLKNIHTDGWQPDAQTLANTKYIYTDYEVVEEPDEEGTMRPVYRPLPESRVPADGEFGDADNPGFTLKTYLSTPYRWNRAIKLPRRLRHVVDEYLHGFEHYARSFHEIEGLEVHSFKEGAKIRLQFDLQDEHLRSKVEAVFEEYLQNAFRTVDELRDSIVYRDDQPELAQKEAFLWHVGKVLALQNMLGYGYRQLSEADQDQTAQAFAHLLRKPEVRKELKEAMNVSFVQHIDNRSMAIGQGGNAYAEGGNAESNASVDVRIENPHLAANDVMDLRKEVERLALEHEAWREAYADELEAEFKDLRTDLKSREVSDSETMSRWIALRQRLAQIADKVAGDGRSAEAWLDIAEKVGKHFG